MPRSKSPLALFDFLPFFFGSGKEPRSPLRLLDVRRPTCQCSASRSSIFFIESRSMEQKKMHPKSIRTRSALNAFEKTGPGTGGIAPGAHGGNGGAGAFTGPLLLCTLGLTAAMMRLRRQSMLESCAAGDHLKGERRQDARVASGCEGFTARASARARGTSVACTQLHGVRRYEVRPQTHTRSLHRNSEELSLYRNSYLRSQGP
jgi:hypothetical protein